MGQAQGGKDRSVLRSLSMSVYKELTSVCKDWKPAAFSLRVYSPGHKPAEISWLHPLCRASVRAKVPGHSSSDVREPYLVSASSSVCLSFSHSFPAPNQSSRIQAVRDMVIYNKVCLLFTWIQVRLSQHLIETTKLIPTPTPSLCRQRLTIIWMKT